MKNIVRLTTVLLVSACLSACGQTSEPRPVKMASADILEWDVAAETLLSAEAFMGFAGLKAESSTPLARHSWAKKRVNPDQTRGHVPYTDYLRHSDMMAKVKYRELGLEKRVGGFQVASVNVMNAKVAIPAPLDKPWGQAYSIAQAMLSGKTIEVAIASTATIPVPAKKASISLDVATAVSPVREAAQRVAAIINKRIGQGVFTHELNTYADEPVSQQLSSTDNAASAETEPFQVGVVNMRMGDYEDRTRLVLDLSSPARFDYDLNNMSGILTVHIDGVGWNLDTQRYFDDHVLIDSYEVSQADGGDITLEISLKQPSKMVMSGAVRPDSKRGHRIFFDVAAL